MSINDSSELILVTKQNNLYQNAWKYRHFVYCSYTYKIQAEGRCDKTEIVVKFCFFVHSQTYGWNLHQRDFLGINANKYSVQNWRGRIRFVLHSIPDFVCKVMLAFVFKLHGFKVEKPYE